MNLKFRDKIIILNILITIITIFVIGFMVIQGILYFNIKNTLNILNNISNETNLYIEQSINLKNNDTFTANYLNLSRKIGNTLSENYLIKIALYDNEENILFDNFNYDNIKISSDALYQTLSTKKRNYIYTEINNINYILFSSPITINNETIGAFTIFYSMQQINETLIWVLQCFLYSTLIAILIFIPICMIIYTKVFNPITKLEAASEEIAKGNFNYEKIDYSSNDEIGKLVSSYENMADMLDKQINLITFERESLINIFSGLEDAVFTTNKNKSIITFNKKAVDYFGNDIKNNLFITIPEISEMIDRVITEKSRGSVEFSYNEMFFLADANILNENKENFTILLIVRNITVAKTLENEQMKFISSVSHELRTPLTTIIGYVDMLQRRGTENKELTEKALYYTKKESLRLLRLVTDLLNITKYNNTEFEFIFSDVNMNNLLDDCIYSMKEKCEEKHIEIQYVIDILPLYKGDYDRLKQVIINIIDNALKYSDYGDAIKLVASSNNNEIEISIRDYGEGIPENAQEKIFDAFYRVEEDRSRQTGGAGLGLSIVKYIVEKHSGSISIESKLGKGTMVIIKLPLNKENENEK